MNANLQVASNVEDVVHFLSHKHYYMQCAHVKSSVY